MFRALLVSLGISSLLSACAVPTNSPEQNSFQEFGGYFKVLCIVTANLWVVAALVRLFLFQRLKIRCSMTENLST